MEQFDQHLYGITLELTLKRREVGGGLVPDGSRGKNSERFRYGYGQMITFPSLPLDDDARLVQLPNGTYTTYGTAVTLLNQRSDFHSAKPYRPVRRLLRSGAQYH